MLLIKLNLFWPNIPLIHIQRWLVFYSPENLPLQLYTVYERLLRAEQRGEVLSQELLKVLGYLQNRSIAQSNLSISNSSGESKHFSFCNICVCLVIHYFICLSAILEERLFRHLLPSQPNALIYLPHLKEHNDSLKPIVHLGQRRTGGLSPIIAFCDCVIAVLAICNWIKFKPCLMPGFTDKA